MIVKKQFPNHYIFRIPPVYTNFDDSTLVKRIIKNSLIEIFFGDENHSHSFCSLKTLNNVIVSIINNKIPYGVYNVCDNRLFHIKDLKNIIRNKPLIKLKIKPQIFIELTKLFKFLGLKKIENKINEIYFKTCCNNIYSINKLKNQIKI